MNTTTIAIRTEPVVKAEAKAVFNGLGMDMSTAINLFLKQTIAEQRLPFQPSLRDADNIQARHDAEHGVGKTFDNVDDLIADLND